MMHSQFHPPVTSLSRHLGRALFTLALAWSFHCAKPAEAQAVSFTTTLTSVAGGGSGTCTGAVDAYGDGCTGANAKLSGTREMAIDPQGNVVFADASYNLIRRYNVQTGVVSIVAGGATAICAAATDPQGDGCPATQALLNNARGVAVDGVGNVYIADNTNNLVRVVSASTGIISILAGGGTPCTGKLDSAGDGCPAAQSTLAGATGVATDQYGNVFIVDINNSIIREVSATTGLITVVAGKYGAKCAAAAACGDGASALAATLNTPYSVVVDPYGNLFIADNKDYRVRMVSATTGFMTTIAGTIGDTSASGSSGNGGPALSAHIGGAYNLYLDGSQNLYLADSTAGQVREIVATTAGPNPVYGNIILLAGAASTSSTYPGDGAPANNTILSGVQGVAVDNQGNVYVADASQGRIVRASLNNNFVGTAVGSSVSQLLLAQTASAASLITASTNNAAEFAVTLPAACAAGTSVPAGTSCDLSAAFTPKYAGLRRSTLALTESTGGNPTLALSGVGLAPSLVFTPGTIITAAGTGTAGFTGNNAAATAATLNAPSVAAYDSAGNIFIADTGNNAIRRVDAVTGVITLAAGTGSAGYSGDSGAATSATLRAPAALTVDAAGNLFIADTGNNAVREVVAATGKIVTIAGTGTAGFSGDGALATAATLRAPAGIAVDVAGNVFVSDTGNNAVREVFPNSGFINTIAGSSAGTAGNSGSGGLGRSALLNAPTGLAWQPGFEVQTSPTLTIANSGSSTISQLNLNNGILTTLAGSGTAGFGGDSGAGSLASLSKPSAVAFDAANDLYIADTGNARIRRIDSSTGIITTVAGSGTAGYTGDNASASAANLNAPSGIALDATFNLLVTDSKANVVRRVDVSHGATVNFGNRATYSVSATQVLRLTNAGNLPLTFSAISVAANFQQAAVGSSDCAATTVLAVGATCTLGLQFAPTVAGTINGSAVNTDNTLSIAGSTQTTPLTGVSVLTANKLTLTGLGTTTVAGASQSLTVTALANSTVVTTYTGTVTFSSSDVAASLPSSYTFTTADAGVHTFSNVLLKTAGTQSVTVTDSANSLTASASTTVVAAAPATVTVVSGSGQTAKVSVAFILPLKVQATDSFGNLVSGATITFSAPATGAGGTFSNASATSTAITDSTGIATSSTFTANATAGAYTVTAKAAASTVASFSLTNVSNQYATTTALTLSPAGPQTYGQTLTLTASITPATQGGFTPGGSVLFYDNGVQIASVPLSGGAASTTVAIPSIATHSYTATYSGDLNFAGSTSTASVVIISKATTTLAGSNVTLNYGQAGSATVTVTGQHAGTGVALPGGTVTYTIGTSTAMSAPLNGGVATLPIPATLASGTYTLTATYNGDTNYVSGGTTSLTITVQRLLSTLSLSASPNPANLGTSIVFTATAAPATASAAFPSGNVLFYEGTTLLSTVPLSTGGVATYSTATLAAGSHTIQAQYSGDPNFSGSTATVTAVVVAPAVSLIATPASLTVVQGSYGSTSLTITSVGGLSDTVTLSCKGLPAYSGCVFNIAAANAPSSTSVNQIVLASGTPVTVGFSVGTRGKQGVIGSVQAPFAQGSGTWNAMLGWPGALLAFVMFVAVGRRSRRRLPLLLCLMMLVGGACTGCGSSSQVDPQPTPAGTYTVSVIATGVTSGSTATVPVNVTVVSQ